MNILIADDDDTLRELLPRYLHGIECTLFLATNGEEALKALTTDRIDIAILDVRMPLMDGIEVTKRYMAETDHHASTFIALTADVTPETIERCLSAGFTRCLSKPIRRQDMLEAVTTILKRAPPDAEDDALEGVDKGMIDDIVAVYGGKAEAKAVFTKFANSVERELQQLLRPSSDQGSDHARETTHRLIGTCASMGAPGLSQALIGYKQMTAAQRGPSGRDTLSIWNALAQYKGYLATLGVYTTTDSNKHERHTAE